MEYKDCPILDIKKLKKSILVKTWEYSKNLFVQTKWDKDLYVTRSGRVAYLGKGTITIRKGTYNLNPKIHIDDSGIYSKQSRSITIRNLIYNTFADKPISPRNYYQPWHKNNNPYDYHFNNLELIEFEEYTRRIKSRAYNNGDEWELVSLCNEEGEELTYRSVEEAANRIRDLEYVKFFNTYYGTVKRNYRGQYHANR